MIDSTEYAREIAGALSQNDAGLSIDGVKRVVAAELRELDPTMQVKSTPYFNHSFSPDFVASWPNDPSVSDRFIYLKISSQLDYLIDDVKLVSDQHPIVFTLSPTPTGNTLLTQEIRTASRKTDTLVTDADGLGQLIAHKEIPFVGLAGSAVAQGGRGVLDDDSGERTAGDLRAGFEGALSIDQSSTSAASQAIDEFLNTKYADQMNRLLQAVWIGAGGQLQDFPGSTSSIRSGIADESLQFLLSYSEIENRQFWQRLGGQVGVSQIGRLNLPAGSINLEHFIRANIDSLQVRACRVYDEKQMTIDSPEEEDFKWFVEGRQKLLGLRGLDFIAFFGLNVSDLGNVARRNRGISIGQLLQRANSSRVVDIELSATSNRRRTLKMTSGDGSDVLGDLSKRTSFPELGAGAVPVIKRIGIAMAGPISRTLTCDFQTSTAYRRTSAKISLAELAGEGIPLLHDLMPEELRQLKDIVAEERPEKGPMD